MTSNLREVLEEAEERLLAPYAVRSSWARRRYRLEDEGRAFDYRTAFQRDRDRIVYSRAFRRLRQKAQHGVLPDYEDHRRNRLTHTLEVAQVARTLGRALSLNEDLVEAVALGHDLGQPPFGPDGERALDDFLRGRLDGRGGAGLGDLGGFWRSWQSLRVVDQLEKRYEHPGLNLTDFTREGILKVGASGRVPPEPTPDLDAVRSLFLEGQVVALADRVASALHDLDDALQAGAVEVREVERLAAVRELRRKLGPRYRARAGRFMKANAIHRGLTHLLVTGAVIGSREALERWRRQTGIADAEAFRAEGLGSLEGNEIRLAEPVAGLLEQLEAFLGQRVQRGFEAERVRARGRRVLLGLFAAYLADPRLLEDHVLLRYKQRSGVRYLRDVPVERQEAEIAARYRSRGLFVRVVADFLAGMTDAYAVREHARLMEMGAVPIPSAEQLRREASAQDADVRGETT